MLIELIYNRIEFLRKQQRIPKMEFYKAIEMSGVGFEKMKKNNSLKLVTLLKIAEVLKVPIEHFFFETNKDVPSEMLKDFAEGLNNYGSLIDQLHEQREALKKENQTLKAELLDAYRKLNEKQQQPALRSGSKPVKQK